MYVGSDSLADEGLHAVQIYLGSSEGGTIPDLGHEKGQAHRRLLRFVGDDEVFRLQGHGGRRIASGNLATEGDCLRGGQLAPQHASLSLMDLDGHQPRFFLEEDLGSLSVELDFPRRG